MARKLSNPSQQVPPRGSRRFNQKYYFRNSQHVIHAQQQKTRRRVLTRCHHGSVFGLLPYNAPSAAETRQGIGIWLEWGKSLPQRERLRHTSFLSNSFGINAIGGNGGINSGILLQANPVVHAVWFCWRVRRLAASAQSASWLHAKECAQKSSQTKIHARRCPGPNHH